MLLSWIELTLKQERLQETDNTSQQKHLQKTKWWSFMHSLSCSEKQRDSSPVFPEQPSNTCNYCLSSPMEKGKSALLGSLQEHNCCKECSGGRMATRDLSGPEKITRESAKSPNLPIWGILWYLTSYRIFSHHFYCWRTVSICTQNLASLQIKCAQEIK